MGLEGRFDDMFYKGCQMISNKKNDTPWLQHGGMPNHCLVIFFGTIRFFEVSFSLILLNIDWVTEKLIKGSKQIRDPTRRFLVNVHRMFFLWDHLCEYIACLPSTCFIGVSWMFVPQNVSKKYYTLVSFLEGSCLVFKALQETEPVPKPEYLKLVFIAT